ncbi:MAG TPA: hypothetical protein VFY54_05765, partial [Rubrobacter sp.]|nr:hypothetical protein [Rubrobacter sp.]
MASKNTAALQREMFDAVVKGMARRRGLGAPVRDAFFRHELSDGVSHYPMARLLSSRNGAAGGGRGGKTRLALYLSLIWIASGSDHSSDRPASFWAALRGLPDPDHAGSRVVRSTWRELEARGLVAVDPAPVAGEPPSVKLLREDGSGAPYTIPDGTPGETYRRIPEAAWRFLFADAGLTGAGLAMYLVVIRTAGRAGQLTDLAIARTYFQTEYGLGESTRKNGLRNLVDLGVLDARRRRTDDFGDPSRRGRLRYTYDLLDIYAPVKR